MDFQSNPIYQFLQDLETERISPFTQREKSPSVLDFVQEPVAPYSLDFGYMDDFDFVNLVHQPVASNAGTNEQPATADAKQKNTQNDQPSTKTLSISSSQYTVYPQLGFDPAFNTDAYDMLAQPGTAFEDYFINETQSVSDLLETNELFGDAEASQLEIPSPSTSFTSAITSELEMSRDVSSLRRSNGLQCAPEPCRPETLSPSSSALNTSTPEVETPRDTPSLRWSHAPECGSVPLLSEMSSPSWSTQNTSVSVAGTPRNTSQWEWTHTTEHIVGSSTIRDPASREKHNTFGIKTETRTPAIRLPQLPALPNTREASVPSQADCLNHQVPIKTSSQLITMLSTELYSDGMTRQSEKRRLGEVETNGSKADVLDYSVQMPSNKTGTSNKRVSCIWPGCYRTFADSSTCKRHINGPHRNIRFACPGNCREKAFARMDSLRRHLRLRGPTSSCWIDALASGWASFTNEDGQPDIRKPGTERARKRRKRDA
ncbi:hypothetical protein ACEPAH_9450 [Sanghuangporus vaninii]